MIHASGLYRCEKSRRQVPGRVWECPLWVWLHSLWFGDERSLFMWRDDLHTNLFLSHRREPRLRLALMQSFSPDGTMWPFSSWSFHFLLLLWFPKHTVKHDFRMVNWPQNKEAIVRAANASCHSVCTAKTLSLCCDQYCDTLGFQPLLILELIMFL